MAGERTKTAALRTADYSRSGFSIIRPFIVKPGQNDVFGTVPNVEPEKQASGHQEKYRSEIEQHDRSFRRRRGRILNARAYVPLRHKFSCPECGERKEFQINSVFVGGFWNRQARLRSNSKPAAMSADGRDRCVARRSPQEVVKPY